MSFIDNPNESGMYFAFHFSMKGGSRPYLGYQSKSSSIEGKHTIQLVFSSFNETAETEHPNCNYGADGGAGVSCATRVDIDLNTMYSIHASAKENINGRDIYTGELYNDETNQFIVEIGSFSYPAGQGLFRNSSQDFIEGYISGTEEQTAKVIYGSVEGINEDGDTYTSDSVTVIEDPNDICVFSAKSYPNNSSSLLIRVNEDEYPSNMETVYVKNKLIQDLNGYEAA